MPDAPDLASVSRQLTDVARRVTALEAHRRSDAIDRKDSQARIELALANIIDPNRPNSLVSKVDALYDLMAQIRGVVRFFRIAGGILTAVFVVFELVQVAHSLGWIR